MIIITIFTAFVLFHLSRLFCKFLSLSPPTYLFVFCILWIISVFKCTAQPSTTLIQQDVICDENLECFNQSLIITDNLNCTAYGSCAYANITCIDSCTIHCSYNQTCIYSTISLVYIVLIYITKYKTIIT